MAILKCKMCGGDLNVTADEKIIECEFCGTTQTIPDGNDEKKTNLFNRANRLRIANEFDKAAGIYESIIAEFPDEAESYWGLCLCKFGIEYVDDPKTAKKIPTCHRTSFESIFDDENYKMVIEKSDVIAQGVYKEEATVIDNLQKDILSIVHKEEPFDVFICYKETDELGQRTQDSVLAQDIYDALTDKGFKVFFSRITLEDKLGKQYEPYIFAALNSAKVMLAIGTKEEYYNAVWVKNEWSRYLALMESDKSKMLIPCYRDIDPYDMPQEFKNLQGQDMSKLGFLQDLVRGVSKIVAPEQNKPLNAEPAPITSANATTDSLLKRAFMFLEDGNWKSAEEYCEKVLDINPECAEAYLGKLMSNTRTRKQNELSNLKNTYENNPNYQKICRFGSEQLKKELAEYIKIINRRSVEEFDRQTYVNATDQIRINTIDSLGTAINYLQQISDYRDAEALIEKCRLGIKKLEVQAKADAENARKNREYDKAIGLMKGENSNNYAQAMKIFQSLSGWKAADEKARICQQKIEEIKEKAERERIEKEKRAEAERINKEKQEQAEREEKARIAKRNKKIAIITIPIVCIVIAFIIVLNTAIIPNNKYHEAVALMDAGKYAEAIPLFSGVIKTKDAREKLQEVVQLCSRTISAGERHTVGLKADGAVVATGYTGDSYYYHGQCKAQDWRDIIAVSAGERHTVGLKADGTVVATEYIGDYYNGQCEVQGWKDIIAISAGAYHTVGLKADGTVVATEYIERKDYGQSKVSAWKDIIAISAGAFHTVGLKADGTVVATEYTGDNYHGQCEVQDWDNIVAIATSAYHTVGLKADGTVVATKVTGVNEYGQCDVSEWTDIIAISAGYGHTVGLKADGTVVATKYTGSYYENQCEVAYWSDIVAISANDYHTVGLKADGSVVVVGDGDDGQCDVQDWNLLK